MGQLKLSTASGGSITLDPTNTASNLTITVPASTATMAINGPAFSAFRSSSQSISAATFTKVQFDTELFDTASAYDNSTNYRFQPLVAGYYQVNANINYASSAGQLITSVYKNGSRGTGGEGQIIATLSGGTGVLCANLVYMNGSTDYLEIYAYSSGSNTLNTGTNSTWFSASMARAA